MMRGEIDGDDGIDDYGDEINSQPTQANKKQIDEIGASKAMTQIIKGSEEIQWWLSRAISFCSPIFGEVHRYL